MANWYDVESCYEEGLKEKKNGNLMKAARLFRISYITYENCDLPPFYVESIEKAGMESHEEFRKIYPRLTEQQRELLRNERRGLTTPVTDQSEDFVWGWKKLVSYDYDMIMKEDCVNAKDVAGKKNKENHLGSSQSEMAKNQDRTKSSFLKIINRVYNRLFARSKVKDM